MVQTESGGDEKSEKSGKHLGWAAIAAFNTVSYTVLAFVIFIRDIQMPSWLVAPVFLAFAVNSFLQTMRWVHGDFSVEHPKKKGA